jgi:hypothetical protein
VELTDALAVRVDRWWPLLCADPACCPPEGTLLPGDDEPSVLATTLAAHGCRALPDRAAVVRSIEPVTGAVRAAMEQALDRAAGWLGSRLAGGEAVTVVCAETVQAFARAVDRYAERPGLEADDAARLILGLRDLRARDEILAWAARPDTDALLSLLVDLTRRAVPPLDAPVACALAWVAYARGDGTLANVAVTRCLASDPGYTMGRLLHDALEAGVHPRHVRRVSREVSADLRAQRETDRRADDQRADGERRDDQRPDDQRTEKP